MKKIVSLLIVISCFVLPSFSLEVSSNDSLLTNLSTTNDPHERINIFFKLAVNYLNQDIPQSLVYANEILLLLGKLPDDSYTEKGYNGVAILFVNCNVYDKAYECFLKSLRISEQLGNRVSMCETNSNIGGVYLRLLKYEEALSYFLKSLKMGEELIKEGNKYIEESRCAFYNNVGLAYGKLGKKDVGISYIEKAIDCAPREDEQLLAQYYGNIAPLYYETGEKEQGIDCMNRSKRLYKQIGDELGVGYCAYFLSTFYKKEGQTEEVKKYLDEAYEIAERIKTKTLLRDVYELYVELYDKEKNYQQVATYQKKLYEVKTALINEEVLGKVTTLRLQYDFHKKEAQSKLELQRLTFRHRLLLTVAGLVIVILGLLFWLIRTKMLQVRAEKNILEKDLESRNKELTTNAIFLMRNTELVRDISLRLINLEPNLKTENVQIIKTIIDDLQTLTRDDLWKDFEARFNRVHIDFYSKLKASCPELTPSELKLCAFLRLNMSTKEIASLIGITERSIDVIRGRIRKKLNINNTNTNLVTYLAEF